jgi:hypothetical protein
MKNLILTAAILLSAIAASAQSDTTNGSYADVKYPDRANIAPEPFVVSRESVIVYVGKLEAERKHDIRSCRFGQARRTKLEIKDLKAKLGAK